MTEAKLCRVEGCTKPKRKKRSMCATHMYRWQEHKSFDLPTTKMPEGKITHCGIHGYLSIEETYPSGKTRYGKERFRCKKCRYQAALKYRKLNREKHLLQSRRYDSNNKKRLLSRFKEKLKKFGITLEQYEEMFIKQNNTCWICKKHEDRLNLPKNRTTKLCIDHCHKTGKVRGLLCWRCNALLGMVDDSIPILEEAINYLRINN